MGRIAGKFREFFNVVFGDDSDERETLYDKIIEMLHEAVDLNSSDIHFCPHEAEASVFFRIDGELTLYKTVSLNTHVRTVNILKLHSDLDNSRHDTVQEGQMAVLFSGHEKKNEFRVSIMPSEYGEKAVVRVLGRYLISGNRRVLGFSEKDDFRLEKALAKRRGLILLCGATGSGKTTTIYSFLNSLNNSSVNITTIEDPIEYAQESITQTEVNDKKGYTYDVALKALLRQDVDIIYVGEIRDSKTASAAINAVMTGHMVFSSVHSENILGAYNRLVKLGVNPYHLVEVLNTVICQTLVKRVCPHCSTVRKLSSEERSLLGVSKDMSVRSESEVGCESCDGAGSKGRIAAYEMFIPEESDRHELSADPSTVTFKRVLSSQPDFNASLIRLMRKGIISVEECIRNLR